MRVIICLRISVTKIIENIASNSKNNISVVLASGSPRRKQLLELLEIPFEACAGSLNEIYNEHESPEQIVQKLAFQKAEAVGKNYSDALIIGADTLVVLNDEIIGKPDTQKDAAETLHKLSGRAHQVVTGVALLKTGKTGNILDKLIFSDETKVTFGELNSTLIKNYLKTGDAMDKAGAYGIQDKWGAIFVKRIEGDFYNVMGLPLHALFQRLKTFAPEFFNSNDNNESAGRRTIF